MDTINKVRRMGLYLSPVHKDEMLAWVQHCLPEEACGLLAGECRTVSRVIPIENALHSSSRFNMDAKAQIKAFLEMENNGQEMVGFFHSHPNGPLQPSQTDVAEFFYPGTVAVICAPGKENWEIHGYWIEAEAVVEVPLISILTAE